MKALLYVAVFCFFSNCFATIQEKDLIVFNGKRIYTHNLPGLDKAFPGLLFPTFEMISTGNYKGYRASWAIFDKKLYLIGIEGKVIEKDKLIGNKEIIKNKKFPIHAKNWSGKIIYDEKSKDVKLGSDKSKYYKLVTKKTISIQKGIVKDISTKTVKEKFNIWGF